MIPSKLYLPSNSSVPGNRISRLKKLVASSKPNCDGSDCYLVGLLSDFCHIVIYKLFDQSWTIVEPDRDSKTYFMDVEIIGTKLYASNPSSYSILVYDLKDSTNGPPKAKVLVKLPKRPSELSIIGNHCLCFLAKDEALRELYFIYTFCNAEFETQDLVSDSLIITSAFVKPPRVTGFELFKLVTNKDHIEWKNVKLEDRVVFVSNYKSMIMSRDELDWNKKLIKGNSTYFVITYTHTKILASLMFFVICY
ncbi:hypothetical protein MtrunA17_Chr1g0156941 [Medicago truncatula]|nr:uncharacterized protein LOC120580153 [Medicago truncatula]RHN77640.1 hypothetical protein MtrunA17_Chr1g0156941 [Medicago truncatula]